MQPRKSYHINCSIRAYVRLKVVAIQKKITIYDAKWEITKPAITEYLKNPKYAL